MENIAPVSVNSLTLLTFTLGVSIATAVILGILLKLKSEKLEDAELRLRLASRK